MKEVLDNLLLKKKDSLGDKANDQGLRAKQLSAKAKRLKTFSEEKELIQKTFKRVETS